MEFKASSHEPANAKSGLRARREQRWATRFRRRLAWCLASLAIIGCAGWYALSWVPLPASLFNPPPRGGEWVDRHGRFLRAEPLASSYHAQPVTFQTFPPSLIQATLAAEDKRFWHHPGVDPLAILRALNDWGRHGRPVSGASTITQQLIKLAQPRPRTMGTKILEAIQAARLEQVWSKEEILSAYFNRLDYGNLNLGCAAASAFYFGKPPMDLSVAEAAFLAGLPQAPTRLNPHRHFDRAVRRQHWILERMAALGWLTQAELCRALTEPIGLAASGRPFRAPHFSDLLRQTGEDTGAGAGVVRTTLDLELNRQAELILRRHLDQLRDHQARQGAVVVLDNRTGDVLALVGSRDYYDLQEGQVNGAWAPRSPGSTLKPFTYWLALERGASPATVVADLPARFPTPTGVFSPLNYDRRCYGPVRYRLALANSLNIAAVKVLHDLGGASVLRDRLQSCGLTTLTRPPDHYGLGLTLGNAEVRLLELVNAYACLARLGSFRPYRLRADQPAGPATRVGDPDAAWLVADILSDSQARAMAFGIESPLDFGFKAACKTGTSSDFRDNWAVGFTPEFSVGVWIGNFDASPMRGVSGVSGAAPVLRDLFQWLRDHHGTSWYAPRDSLVSHSIHPVSGQSWTGPDAIREYFVAGRHPEPMDADALDELGRLRLPREYETWLRSSDNWLGQTAVAGANALPDEPWRLVSPLDGTIYFLDPDLPESSGWLPLKADGGFVVWECPSLRIEETADGPSIQLAEGLHHITARSVPTGEAQSVWIEVRAF